MTEGPASRQQLLAEIAALRARLHDAEETLRAIQGGEADAFVLSGSGGEQIHTMTGALEPYRVMVEAMGEGAVTLAGEGTLLYCNSHFAEWIKLPREQIAGRAMQGMIAKQDRERFAAMLSRGAQEVVRETLLLQAADGTQTPALFSLSPLPQSEGKVISVVIADLSEVIAAAAARSRLALIVDSSDDAIVSTTLEGVVESWNRAAEQLFGYSADEAIGRPLQTLTILPEYADEVSGRFDAIGRGEQTGRVECMWRRKDGSLVEVSVIYSPILDPAGGIVGASINTRDITARKRVDEALKTSEEKYRRLFENAQIGIFMTRTSDGKLMLANDAMAKMFGYDSSDEATANYITSEHYVEPGTREKLIDLLEKHGRFDNFEAHLTRNDGVARWFLYSGRFVENDHFIEGIAADITERKQMETALRASEEAHRTLSQNLPGMIYRVHLREGGRMQFFNAMTTQMTGYAADELVVGEVCSIEPLILDEERPGVEAEVMRAIAERRAFTVEYRLRHKDGGIRWMSEHGMPVYGTDDAPIYIDGLIFDITERKQTQELLRQSEEKFRALVESTSDWIWEVDQNGVYTYVSPRVEALLGYPPEEVLGKTPFDFMPADEIQRVGEVFKGLIDKRAPLLALENANLQQDGRVVILETNGLPFFDDNGEFAGYRGIDRDITERKQAEQILHDEKIFSETLVQGLPDIFFFLDRQGSMLRWNKQFEVLFGLSAKELSESNALAFVHEDDRPRAAKSIQQVFETGSATVEARLVMAGGLRDYILIGTKIETTLGINLIGIGVDITERKEAEEALRRANRALKTLSAGNLALVRAEDEDELLHSLTRVIAEQAGYSMAVVDYAEDDPQRSLTPMAWSGFEGSDYLAENLSWADTERGQLPIARAIRSGTTQVCHDITTDPSFNPWREAVQAHGYQANIALPLRDDGKTFGALSIYSSDGNAFDEEEIPLLKELANDLAYGIINLRTRIEHEQHAIILRQSLEQSVQTIAATVEARDPYTAGHQKRVANLATAIAREMGLPEEQVSGIHFAGIIHDLGKIHVPAEILSKPGRLNPIEFQLIQMHPQEGYDILKEVIFPWPIANIILQHHEKLDGSGYPQGLKGEQILLEARIITVADVVEAMSSHRPYRAGLGIEAALAEIEAQRGIQFDPLVVDACLKLFREGGYRIPD